MNLTRREKDPSDRSYPFRGDHGDKARSSLFSSNLSTYRPRQPSFVVLVALRWRDCDSTKFPADHTSRKVA